MGEARDILENTKVLVLWSGGKDSMLASCQLLAKGYNVVLLSINGGSLYAEEYLLHGVKRLQHRWGNRVEYAGIYCTAPWVLRMGEWWTNTELQEIAKGYPSLTWTQVRCLHCQSSMWLAAIAYACAHDIRIIASGYKHIDKFCTGVSEYWDCIRDVAKKNGVEVVFPCIELGLDEGFERDNVMLRFNFHPSVLEPKCLLGSPPTAITDAVRKDLVAYTYVHVLPVLEEGIAEMTRIFKHIQLDHTSFPLYDVENLDTDN